MHYWDTLVFAPHVALYVMEPAVHYEWMLNGYLLHHYLKKLFEFRWSAPMRRNLILKFLKYGRLEHFDL